MRAVAEHAPRLGVMAMCLAFALARATYYRRRGRVEMVPRVRKTSPRALSTRDRQAVLDVLHEPRFVDVAPAQVYAALLDEGTYLCSQRTIVGDHAR